MAAQSVSSGDVEKSTTDIEKISDISSMYQKVVTRALNLPDRSFGLTMGRMALAFGLFSGVLLSVGITLLAGSYNVVQKVVLPNQPYTLGSEFHGKHLHLYARSGNFVQNSRSHLDLFPINGASCDKLEKLVDEQAKTLFSSITVTGATLLYPESARNPFLPVMAKVCLDKKIESHHNTYHFAYNWLSPAAIHPFTKHFASLDLTTVTGEVMVSLTEGYINSLLISSTNWFGGNHLGLAGVLIVLGSIYFLFSMLMLKKYNRMSTTNSSSDKI